VRFADLPAETGGAVLARRPGRAWIVLDRRLDGAGRRSRLAHELVHLERGPNRRDPASPPQWDAVIVREEAAVDREAARRLVPDDELDQLADRAVELGDGVGTAEVATEFEVSPELAEVALAALVRRRAGRSILGP
jgi:hypothetical protein